MSSHYAIGQWLAGWGRPHGLNLALNKAGECAFAYGDVTVQVNVDETGREILCAALLAEQDVSGNAQALRALLQWAHLGAASHRCAVSLAASGRPVLWRWLDGAQQDELSLANSLTGFCLAADKAREHVADAGGSQARREGDLPVSDLAMSSFLRA